MTSFMKKVDDGSVMHLPFETEGFGQFVSFDKTVGLAAVVLAVGFDRRRAGIWMHQPILPSVHYAQRARSLPQFAVTSPEMYCLP